MNYYLKYLKYKQKYLDLKNLDLIGGLSLSKYNYNNLDGGVPGIASDYKEHAHLLDDYANEEIADYWRTNINSTTFSANTGIGGIHQPGYYLMFYDSNGDYYDTTNDEKENPRNPKFFNNHIHLLESKLENGRNAISFTLKLKNNKIKIFQECFLDVEHLNKYCKKKEIVGYDKLRMMIFLLKDFKSTYYTPTSSTSNQYDILLDNTNLNLTYVINGVTRPILFRREIKKCIETLETYAIICTAISKIDDINTGRTGEINFYEAMNPTQFNQYLREINQTELSSNDQKERYKLRLIQIQDKKEEFLRKTEKLIEDSEKSIIKMSQVIFDFKSDYNIPFKEVFSQQLIDETLKKMQRDPTNFYSHSNETYEERHQKILDKTNPIFKVMENYNLLKQSLEENALKIREVNEDNNPHTTLKDMGLNKDEMLTLNDQDEPFELLPRYNWTKDVNLLLPELLPKLSKLMTWPKWYDWLVKREKSKINIEYRKRVEERATKLEKIKPHLEYMKRKEDEEERAKYQELLRRMREAESGGPIRKNHDSIRYRPYAR